MAFMGKNPSGRTPRPAYIIKNCKRPIPAEMPQMRKKYRRRSWVWAKPSTVQNRKRGAASRPAMENHRGITPVNWKK